MDTSLDLAVCDKLLTTTRSIRKRLDLTRPVPPELIEECLTVAAQSPSATNTQLWRFVVVTDPETRAGLAKLYKKGFELYWAEADEASYGATGKESVETEKMIDSAVYLVNHLHEVPVHVLFCIEQPISGVSVFEQATAYGSIIPAAWSFMLAARARGLGCCWTTVHLKQAEEAAQLLGLPDTVNQCVLLPVAYYTGTGFKVAPRISAKEMTHWDTWGNKR